MLTYFIKNFQPEINIPLILLMICIAFGVKYYIYNGSRSEKIIKASLFAVFIAYCYFIIAVTLINRSVTNVARAEWIPFWSWIQIIEGNKALNILEESLLNVVLFIPFGCLLTLNWKMSILRAAMIGLGLSVIIEIMQLITHRGVFQWDDMLYNTLGCIIGALIIKTIKKRYYLHNGSHFT